MVRSPALFLLLTISCSGPPQYYETWVGFIRQQETFRTLTDTLLANSHITEIGLGMEEVLNDQILIADSLSVDSSHGGLRHRVPKRIALTQAALTTAAYDGMKSQMQSLGVIAVYVTSDYVALVLGGFLDNEYGLIRQRPGRPLPDLNSKFADGVDLVYLRHIRGPWTYFATT